MVMQRVSFASARYILTRLNNTTTHRLAEKCCVQQVWKIQTQSDTLCYVDKKSFNRVWIAAKFSERGWISLSFERFKVYLPDFSYQLQKTGKFKPRNLLLLVHFVSYHAEKYSACTRMRGFQIFIYEFTADAFLRIVMNFPRKSLVPFRNDDDENALQIFFSPNNKNNCA